MTDELVAFFKDPESKTLDLPVVCNKYYLYYIPDFSPFLSQSFGTIWHGMTLTHQYLVKYIVVATLLQGDALHFHLFHICLIK